MKTFSIFIKTRYYGGGYIARVYDPKPAAQASCTHSAEVAAGNAAAKVMGGDQPTRLVKLEEGRFRAEYDMPNAALSESARENLKR